MLTSKILLLAEGVVRDAETNNISVFNIMEEINSPQYPVVIPKVHIFNMLERKEGDQERYICKYEITIGDEKILSNELDVVFQDTLLARNIIFIGGFPVIRPDIITVSVSVEDHTLDTYTVFAKQTIANNGMAVGSESQ